MKQVEKGQLMRDLVIMIGSLLFFVAMFALIVACERLGTPTEGRG